MTAPQLVLAAAHLKGPHVDWAGLSPLVALLAGTTIVLLAGLFSSALVREQLVPALSVASLGAALGLTVWQWNSGKSIISGALRVDDLALALNLILFTGGILVVLLSWRAAAPRESAHGEYFALLLTSAAGMSTLVAAQNT